MKLQYPHWLLPPFTAPDIPPRVVNIMPSDDQSEKSRVKEAYWQAKKATAEPPSSCS